MKEKLMREILLNSLKGFKETFKRTMKRLLIELAKDTVINTACRFVEKWMIEKPMDKIVDLCEKNGYDPADYMPFDKEGGFKGIKLF